MPFKTKSKWTFIVKNLWEMKHIYLPISRALLAAILCQYCREEEYLQPQSQIVIDAASSMKPCRNGNADPCRTRPMYQSKPQAKPHLAPPGLCAGSQWMWCVRGRWTEATGGRIGSSVVLTFPLYHSDTPFLSTSLHWGVLIVCKFLS